MHFRNGNPNKSTHFVRWMISREQALRTMAPASRYKYFRQDEIALIFAEMERLVVENTRREKYTRRYRLLINVLYHTGARIDEVLPARDKPYKRLMKSESPVIMIK